MPCPLRRNQPEATPWADRGNGGTAPRRPAPGGDRSATDRQAFRRSLRPGRARAPGRRPADPRHRPGRHIMRIAASLALLATLVAPPTATLTAALGLAAGARAQGLERGAQEGASRGEE